MRRNLRWAQGVDATARWYEAQFVVGVRVDAVTLGRWQVNRELARNRVRAVGAELASALRRVAAALPRTPALWADPGWHVAQVGRGLSDLLLSMHSLVELLGPWRALDDSDGLRQDAGVVGDAVVDALSTPGRAWRTLTGATLHEESWARWAGAMGPGLTPVVTALGRRAATALIAQAETVGQETATAIAVDTAGQARVVGVLAEPKPVPVEPVTPRVGAVGYGSLTVAEPSPSPWIGGSPVDVLRPRGQRLYTNYGSAIAMEQDHRGVVTYIVQAEPGVTPPGGQMTAEALARFRDITAVEDFWGTRLPDNLRTFNQALQAGIAPEQAAWLTFTGKMAARIGLQEVVIGDTVGTPGLYTDVSVQYLPPRGVFSVHGSRTGGSAD